MSERSASSSGLTGRMLLRIALLFSAMLLLPFPIAGSWGWPGAWANGLAMVLFFAVTRLVAWRRNPELLAERGRYLGNAGIKSWDRILSVLVGMVGYLAIVLVAALGRRLSWEPEAPPPLVIAGFALVILGNAFSSWAFLANRFFSGVVRIQTERGHVVVDTGPYRIVRHPGYLGGVAADLGSALLLGSYWALIPAACTVAALIARTSLEDATLREELPGYAEYTRRTRYRLFPGIW